MPQQPAGQPPPLPGPNTPGGGQPEVVPSADLPRIQTTGQDSAARQHPAPPPVRSESSPAMIGIFGDLVRTGSWPAARITAAYQLFGDAKLDLRQVLKPGETLTVNAYSMFGDVRIVVPPGTEVEISGMNIFGDARNQSDLDQPAQPTGARLVVNSYSIFGDVRVREMELNLTGKPPLGWRWVNR